MGISAAVQKTFRSLFPANEKNGSFRLPKLLEICLGVVIFLELLAPFVSTSYGLDGMRQLNWISQFGKLVSEGVLIPRWVPDGFFGFGATSFYFYPPVTFYLTTAISAVTSITSAAILFQTVSLLGTVASFFAFRAFARSIGSSGYQMNLAAVLYTVAPFRIVELYHRGALPTHLTYALIPIVLLGLVAIVRKKGSFIGESSRFARIIFLGASSAVLVLTNVPVTLVSIICICVAAVVVRKEIQLDTLLDAALSGIVAITLTAFHFAAIISAQLFTKLQDTFVLHPNLVLSTMLEGINWLYLYHLFFVYVPALIIAFAYWKTRRSGTEKSIAESIAARIGLVLLSVVIFLDLPPLSRTLWNDLAPFQIIQFTMRFYPYLILFVCVIVGLARSAQMKRAALAGVWVMALGAIPPAILIVLNLHLYSHYTVQPEDAVEYRPIYTVRHEDFWQTMKPHSADPAAIIANSQSGERLQRRKTLPYYEEFDAVLNAPRSVTFHRFYWPYWHLYANDKEIIAQPDSIGRAVATLPEGHYALHWQLEKTPLERGGMWVSGIAWAGLLAASGIGLVRRSVKRKLHTQ